MDLLELQTLADELTADADVAVSAFLLAARRFEERSPAANDSAAHHLARSYNVIEQMALRVAKAFENAVDGEKGWHTGLIRRLSIRISGVRPGFFPEELRQPLHELRAFRHVFVHAYDLEVVSRVRSSLTFSGRGIPAGGVARRLQIPDLRVPRALPSGRHAPENLSPNF